MIRKIVFFIGWMNLMAFWACNSEQDAKLSSTFIGKQFTLQKQTGISFQNTITETPQNNILNYDAFYGGGGVTVADFNNDGLPDIFLTGNQVPNELYWNRGDWQFQKAEIAILEKQNRWSKGASVVDINQDGWLDIYVCNSGPDFSKGKRKNQLLVNDGKGGFTEEAASYGIDDDAGSNMASFFDYDKDGDLDLFISNSSQFDKWVISDYDRMEESLKNETYAHLPSYHSQSCHFYKNTGGRFEDITEQSGMLKLGYGLGVITKDFNEDGWTDIYVANDYHIPDNLYINQKNGMFKDEIKLRTRHTPFFSMGCDFEDINLDGFADLVVLDMSPVGHYRSKTLMSSMDATKFYYLVNNKQYQHQYMFNSLQLNNQQGFFRDIGLFSGIAKSEWSWAALLNDFDLDGYNDLYVTNGFKRDTKHNDWRNELLVLEEQKADEQAFFEHLQKTPSQKTKNFLFKNNGDLTFSKVQDEWGLDQETFSNGAIYADFDLDGDMDLVVNNVDEKAHLYKNNAIEKGNKYYLKVRLSKNGKNYPKEAINAQVRLYKEDKVWFKEWHSVAGYQSSCLMDHLIFGLGKVKTLDSIEVVWHTTKGNERISKLQNVTSNQLISIDFKDAKKINDVDIKINTPTLFSNIKSVQHNLDFRHIEDSFNDFEQEILLPHRMSQLGPNLSVGDPNGDRQMDFFIGGAKGQTGQLLVQKDGIFYKTQGLPWQTQAEFEDMGSLFFDVDNDGDEDLYIVSGGSSNTTDVFQDRLYLNEGENGFRDVTKERLPIIRSSGSKVIANDFDKDGDIDLFVAGRHVPQKYPQSPVSHLLINTDGNFKDKTVKIGGEKLQKAGMLTDAIWMDIDQDQDDDLVLVGEWTGIQIFENQNGQLNFKDQSLTALTGWWQSVTPVDFDQDGDLDLLVGNMGKNSKFKASVQKPLHINATDFDNNGTNDIVLSTYDGTKRVPVRGRQCSSEQMPFIADKFPTYNSFALAGLEEIYPEEKIEKSVSLNIVTLESYLIENLGNYRFKKHLLPNIAQLAPINSCMLFDINKDKLPDLLIAGNLYETEVETPRYDSGIGQVLINKGDFKVEAVSMKEAGLYLPMDVKDMCKVPTASGDILIIANNNNYLQCYKSNF